MKKTTLILTLLTATLYAADFQPAPPPAETQEALIQALKNGRNTAAMVEYIDAIATVPFSDDIYEISFKGSNNEILYVSKDGGYIFQSDIIAVAQALNITRERREALAAAKGIAAPENKTEAAAKSADEPPAKAGKKSGDGQFAALASELALKEQKGDGSRRLWLMTAPDCDMCKTLEEQIANISDVTLYRYLYTGDEEATRRAIAIHCHHNPSQALRDYLLYGLASEEQLPAACGERAGETLRRIREETGHNADRAELPVLFFPDGEETRILPADSDELERWITIHQLPKNDTSVGDDQAATMHDNANSDPVPVDNTDNTADERNNAAALDTRQTLQPPENENHTTAVRPQNPNLPPAIRIRPRNHGGVPGKPGGQPAE